ncbi:peptide methionine sulfoxide reductase MsrA [Chitiniphilus shinanonensis]|uniref:Peptide methionine sulfoxide reductase MsrA n=1 Tax=Chitiniphilus shinanonensis TaxID=553088 RepID=A0ABQ6BQP4_9NEIS|nr:peptide-methionine (S)-S-oxide reductase MsrA [Chitiniphilus shinanonensis]GLS04146.1 peptide methionine sulfoxide reductase MsrA [Chitiniphilus shinanonensis]
MHEEIATLAGGCFWCLEAVFQRVRGVRQVVSGYLGGHTAQPDYRSVCGGGTGHAEAVRIAFDPQVVSYDTLLDIFFAIHDPTTLNRQGNDVGTQYRSAIFFHGPEQEATARAKLAELAPHFAMPIVTELRAAPQFHPAEDYHQNYFNQHGDQPYCQLVAAPKVAKLRQYFAPLLDE